MSRPVATAVNGPAVSGDEGQMSVSTLRGASVTTDARRVGRVILGLVLLAAVVTGVALTVAGVRKNEQVTALREHGVPVEVRVSGCIGLMGGSGSNLAGYQCRGWYRFDGRRHVGNLPGDALHPPGSQVRAVVDAADPSLFSTPAVLATEHASDGVLVVPGVLLAGVVTAVGALALRQRRRRGTRRRPAGDAPIRAERASRPRPPGLDLRP